MSNTCLRSFPEEMTKFDPLKKIRHLVFFSRIRYIEVTVRGTQPVTGNRSCSL